MSKLQSTINMRLIFIRIVLNHTSNQDKITAKIDPLWCHNQGKKKKMLETNGKGITGEKILKS